MAAVFALIALLSSCSSVQAVDQQMVANPIRKVVNMLQNMQKKVEDEGKKEADLYEKFMCYCKTSGGDLSKSVADADAKMPALGSSIKEGESKKKQLEEEIKAHQKDRQAAKAAMSEAAGLREKDTSTFQKEKAEYTANLDALKKAISAVTAGMSSSFLQTGAAQLLKQLALGKEDMQDLDRQDILAFLSGTQSDFMPQSGEIVGILKNLREDMAKALAASEKAEAAAAAEHEDLLTAKKEEVELSTQAIETKNERVGELAVDIIEMKNDLTDTEEQVLEDKKFLADLDTKCATQTKEWEVRQQARSEELLALADTIKLLSDDDALELFKKTLPSTSASLIQVTVDRAYMKKSALRILQSLQNLRPPQMSAHRPQLDFISLALRGKTVGFEKVIHMIDGMIKTLEKEQMDDDHKKEYCTKQFEFAKDKKKVLKKKVSDLSVFIEESTEGMASLADEIKALTAGIKALDASVQEATEQRKAEHEDFTELMASDAAAKELLKFAMNRLHKFYSPKLYKPPPKRDLSEQDRATLAAGGTLAPTAAPGGIAGTGISFAQVSAHASEEDGAAPPPAPATLEAYSKKSEESGGVIQMIKLLIKDLEKEMQDAEQAEKDAQADYEKMLSDAAEKRSVDGKSLTEKTAAKAALESDADADKEAKVAGTKELMAAEKYLHSLHSECDWLLQYFDIRAEARSGEIDGLSKAKSVLNGADFSLLQEKSARRLHRAFMQPHA